MDMQIADFNNPGEKKKLIVAGGLGLLAIVFLWWTFFGFGSRTATPSRPAVTTPSSTAGKQVRNTPVEQPSNLEGLVDDIKVVVLPVSPVGIPEARRNIFAYYEPPPRVAQQAVTSTPTPTPTPPVLLAAVSPSNVYARTSDFPLEVSGDKFSSELHIFVDGRELATRYQSPQQLSATVPAAMIANPGARQILVRSVDGRLYSNAIALNVAPPPTPNYSYVGIISTTHRVDIALVQDKGNKEIINAQRGDVLGGRFRVTSISEKELVLVDTNLKIKHSLAMSEGERGAGPLARPTPRVAAEDDEP